MSATVEKNVLQDNRYREQECVVLALIRVEKEHVGPEGGVSDLVTFGVRLGDFVDFEITVRMSGRLSEEVLVTDAKSLVRRSVEELHSHLREHQYRNDQNFC